MSLETIVRDRAHNHGVNADYLVSRCQPFFNGSTQANIHSLIDEILADAWFNDADKLYEDCEVCEKYLKLFGLK